MISKHKCVGIGCTMRRHLRDGNLAPLDLRALEESMVFRTHARGDKIFSQGAEATGLFCLRSGHVLLCHEDAYKYKTAFRVVGAGEIMGHRSLFGEDKHAATAQALSTCDVCHYPADVILALIEQYPSFARCFLRTLARDRGPRDALILRAQHLPVRIRLVNLILLMMQRERCGNGGACILQLPMLRRDIAALLATRPESVARAIKQLGDDRVAHFNGRSVTIPSVDILYQESSQEMAPTTTPLEEAEEDAASDAAPPGGYGRGL